MNCKKSLQSSRGYTFQNFTTARGRWASMALASKTVLLSQIAKNERAQRLYAASDTRLHFRMETPHP